MSLTIFVWIVFGFLALIGILVVLLLVLVLLINHYGQKFIWNLPIMKWMTLDDTKSLGVPLLFRVEFLMVLHEEKHLEVRPKEGLPEELVKQLDTWGFTRRTIVFYEFRLTVHPRRRKKFDAQSFLKKFFPDFDPPALPA